VCVSPFSVNWDCRKASWDNSAQGFPNQCTFPAQLFDASSSELFGQCQFVDVSKAQLAMSDEVLAVAAARSNNMPTRNDIIQVSAHSTADSSCGLLQVILTGTPASVERGMILFILPRNGAAGHEHDISRHARQIRACMYLLCRTQRLLLILRCCVGIGCILLEQHGSRHKRLIPSRLENRWALFSKRNKRCLYAGVPWLMTVASSSCLLIDMYTAALVYN
jgi:hypothetical protein